MTKKRLLMAIVISFIVLLPAVVLAEGVQPAPEGGAVTTEEVEVKPKNSVLVRQSLTRTKFPKATNAFWDELAICETASNWQDSGKWSGGLGIYQGTWEFFGGTEFAPSPAKATREEQIVVANRISTQGYKTIKKRDPDWARRNGVPDTYLWEKEPVGFGGWGCYKSKSTGKYRMAKPRLYYHDHPHKVPFAEFYFNERGALVKDLQTYLRITVDGHYGAKTRRAHLRWLQKNGHPTEGVPEFHKKNK